MKTDAEINVLCAKAYGLGKHSAKVFDPETGEFVGWVGADREFVTIPDYLGDIADAMILVDVCQKKGLNISLKSKMGGQWEVIINSIPNISINIFARSRLLPTAITKAFLKLKGIEIDN